MNKDDSINCSENDFLRAYYNGKVAYYEELGKLYFAYREEVFLLNEEQHSVSRIFRTQGIISKKIIEKGEQAIREYAENKIKKEINKQKSEAAEHDEFAKNPDFLIVVEYDHKTLKGKIISAENSVLSVRLDEPYQGKKYVNFGFASGMAGHHIFSGKRTFSKYALKSAKRLLIEIYKEQKYYKKNKEIIDLRKRLNQEEK